MTGASLVLGSFNMSQPDGSTRVLADGTSRGNPVPLEVTVKSWLQDGAIVVTQGHDNRELSVRVRFFGTDGTALAAQEAALFAELEKPNTLTWTPVTGPASVFVVVTSSLDFDETDDEGEGLPNPWRTYKVRLLCEAFPRSVSEVVAAALAASGTTTTLVNDGSATTGWTGAVNGSSTAPTVVSGAVRVTNGSAVVNGVTCSLTLTASIATSATPYLMIDWKPESAAGSPDLRAYGDGVELVKIGEVASPTAGYTRSWFVSAASSIAVLRLDSASGYTFVNNTYPGAVRSLYIDNINRTDVKPALGTNRQLLRSINISGSAATSGSIAIEHASSALGDVLAYFYPSTTFTAGYSPPLRQYRVSGGTVTTDATMVSGARDDCSFGVTCVYDIPVTKLATGSHTLMMKGALGTTISTPISWTAQLRIGSTNVGPAQSGSVTRTGTVAHTIYTLGRVNLPTVDVNETNATAVVRISITSSLPQMDEVWIFNTNIGQLVGPVSCGTAAPSSGGAANRLFLEPTNLVTSRPTIRIGFAADRSDSFFPGTTSGTGFLAGWQLAKFSPSRVTVFTVTTNALDASVSFRYYPRWFTNAAS